MATPCNDKKGEVWQGVHLHNRSYIIRKARENAPKIFSTFFEKSIDKGIF